MPDLRNPLSRQLQASPIYKHNEPRAPHTLNSHGLITPSATRFGAEEAPLRLRKQRSACPRHLRDFAAVTGCSRVPLNLPKQGVRLLLLSSALQPIKEKFELREIIRVEIAVVAEKMVKFDPKIFAAPISQR
jgi:hypothetical protein